ncbi:MAG: class I SAM-dependent methyltransferase [Burkholderiales bacterium]
MDLATWLKTPLGEYLLAREQAFYDATVADIFGYNAFQLGFAETDFLRASRIPLRCRVSPAEKGGLRASFCDLPLATNSVDLIVLPHVLEFSANPHQILREAARALRPEAQLVISGFNPWSLWGLRRTFDFRGTDFPWSGHFINLPRLKDWLALLGLEIAAGQMGCYVPPCAKPNWLGRFAFMEDAGDRWWPIAGGVYFVQAVKRVRGLRLILPKWADRRAPEKKLATLPEHIGKDDQPAAARQSCRRS